MYFLTIMVEYLINGKDADKNNFNASFFLNSCGMFVTRLDYLIYGMII